MHGQTKIACELYKQSYLGIYYFMPCVDPYGLASIGISHGPQTTKGSLLHRSQLQINIFKRVFTAIINIISKTIDKLF